MNASEHSAKVVAQSRTLPQGQKKRHHHHHHRKHRLHQTQQGKLSFDPPHEQVDENLVANPKEVAARYNLSLADTSSGTSSESEFESDNDVCSMTGESSSSQSSAASHREPEPPQIAIQSSLKSTKTPIGGFRRRVGGSGGVGGGTSSSFRPILAGFNQHHYRLQQNWRSSDVEGAVAACSTEGEQESKEGHGGWLANAKRLTSAISESLTRRAANVTTNHAPLPIILTPQNQPRPPIAPFATSQVIFFDIQMLQMSLRARQRPSLCCLSNINNVEKAMNL